MGFSVKKVIVSLLQYCWSIIFFVCIVYYSIECIALSSRPLGDIANRDPFSPAGTKVMNEKYSEWFFQLLQSE